MRYILVFVLFLGFTDLFAQTGYGIKGGVNFSGLQSDNILLVENKGRVGWQAGAFAKSLNDGWGFMLEGYLNVMGSKQLFNDETQRNSVGYITVPLTVSYNMANGFDFYVGGYVSMRMWARRKTSKVGVGDFVANIKDNVAFFDYGPMAGLSFTREKLLFDLRFIQGIPDVNTNPMLNIRARTLGTQLSLFWFLTRQ